MPSCDLGGNQAHICCTDKHVNKPFIHTQKNKVNVTTTTTKSGTAVIWSQKILFSQSLAFREKPASLRDVSKELLLSKRKHSPYLWLFHSICLCSLLAYQGQCHLLGSPSPHSQAPVCFTLQFLHPNVQNRFPSSQAAVPFKTLKVPFSPSLCFP